MLVVRVRVCGGWGGVGGTMRGFSRPVRTHTHHHTRMHTPSNHTHLGRDKGLGRGRGHVSTGTWPGRGVPPGVAGSGRTWPSPGLVGRTCGEIDR